jgi:hypothetical protein
MHSRSTCGDDEGKSCLGWYTTMPRSKLELGEVLSYKSVASPVVQSVLLFSPEVRR